MRNEGIACGDDFFIATVGRLYRLKSFKQMGSFSVGANIVRPLLAELTAYFQNISTIQNQV